MQQHAIGVGVGGAKSVHETAPIWQPSPWAGSGQATAFPQPAWAQAAAHESKVSAAPQDGKHVPESSQVQQQESARVTETAPSRITSTASPICFLMRVPFTVTGRVSQRSGGCDLPPRAMEALLQDEVASFWDVVTDRDHVIDGSFEITERDLRGFHSSAVSWNMRSLGKRRSPRKRAGGHFTISV